MSSLHSFSSKLTLCLILYSTSFSMTCPVVVGLVPANNTFKYINQGEYGIYINEYDADYRMLPIGTHPFQLAFYNTTPSSYTLSLRMGVARSESDRKWIWEANRGNPVGENASLTLGPDGNLVLAEADGRIKWQTNTANRGVVGLDVLANSNIVLYDAKGSYVWQSFDYPTDTLMVGQSLNLAKTPRLVSRLSVEHNANGPYSLVMGPKRLALYYASNRTRKPLVYYTSDQWASQRSIKYVTLSCTPQDTLSFIYYGQDNKAIDSTNIVSRMYHDCTLSFLRVEIDGNLRVYTYDDNVDYNAWDFPMTLFGRETGCQLPRRCKGLGLCEDNNCVACPTEKGLMGWSSSCKGPNLSKCRPNEVAYFQLKGVEHWMTQYNKGDGPIKRADCASKCTKDGSCLAYLYHGDSCMCWIARDLNTFTRVTHSTHMGYIKMCNH